MIINYYGVRFFEYKLKFSNMVSPNPRRSYSKVSLRDKKLSNCTPFFFFFFFSFERSQIYM
jgi:hypothetical protein